MVPSSAPGLDHDQAFAAAGSTAWFLPLLQVPDHNQAVAAAGSTAWFLPLLLVPDHNQVVAAGLNGLAPSSAPGPDNNKSVAAAD
jgi:hypothetical protein